jgi:thiosulfate/3-mercaptopyruvate sulfurtransferase
MSWEINLLLSLVFFAACRQESASEKQHSMASKASVESSYLIAVRDFKKFANQPDVKIIDFCRKGSYVKGPIEGVLHIWKLYIESPEYPYGGMMASLSQIETLMSNLGIQNGDILVIYDDDGRCDATLFWWLLQNYDFKNGKLLYGGITAWGKNGGATSTEIPSVNRSAFKFTKTPSMEMYISKADISRLIATGTTILGTRTFDKYSGNLQKKGAVNAGRIPESINLDWAESVNYDGERKFKPLENLKIIYGKASLGKHEPIVVYCHSGFRSAHPTFLLIQLLAQTLLA